MLTMIGSISHPSASADLPSSCRRHRALFRSQACKPTRLQGAFLREYHGRVHCGALEICLTPFFRMRMAFHIELERLQR